MNESNSDKNIIDNKENLNLNFNQIKLYLTDKSKET
jgi:hypothetical protein